MLNSAEANLPRVSLSRRQWIRLTIVGALVVIALARVVPDLVRVVYPLHTFGYVTDGDGVVVRAPSAAAKGADAIRVGDRVRIDRIRPFDRKPGLAGVGFTYDNPDRYLPIERAGRERILHLIARPEGAPQRVLAVLRIVLCMATIGLGALLFLVKPSIATGAFFVFCLGADAPTTYLDLIVPQPWRPLPILLGDTLRGTARTALLVFAFCLIDEDADSARERPLAWAAAFVGGALGLLLSYGIVRRDFLAQPAQPMLRAFGSASTALEIVTILCFAVAWWRARDGARRRATWIVLAFAFAAGARAVSDAYFPGRIPLWFNSLLVSTTIVPAVVVWIAVIRHRFFDVDFVVSRAIVYVSLTAAVIGTISVIEEFGTYVFYNNTDLAYGVLIAVSMIVGAFTGKIKTLLDGLVDRFIFRDRRQQRQALEYIAGYILDAETTEDVYRALLEDAAHALSLTFGGIFMRTEAGGYELERESGWPPDCVRHLAPDAELTRTLAGSRGVLTFSGRESALIRDAFPHERLTFAAPLFLDRRVTAIVVYGHNVSGLDLDPEEREMLVRVVAHASIALNEIELARYRAQAGRRELNAPLLGNG